MSDVMTVVKSVEVIGAVVPAALVAEVVMPPAESWIERLGVAAVLVVAFYFVVRWFMAQMELKDAVIKEITNANIQAQEANTKIIVAALHEGHDVKRQMTEALAKLTEKLVQVGKHPHS